MSKQVESLGNSVGTDDLRNPRRARNIFSMGDVFGQKWVLVPLLELRLENLGPKRRPTRLPSLCGD